MMPQPPDSLPFLGTHIANLALNPALGLRFLEANTQITCGLTGLSGMTMLLDKLQIARWMLLSFLVDREPEHLGHGHEEGHESWIQIEPFVPKMAMAMPVGAMNYPDSNFERAMTQLEGDLKELDKATMWTDDEARQTLLRLCRQLRECIDYFTELVTYARIGYQVPSDPSDVLGMAEAMMSVSMRHAAVLGDAFPHPAMAYLMLKDAITVERIFATHLLKAAMDVIVPKAVEEGYER